MAPRPTTAYSASNLRAELEGLGKAMGRSWRKGDIDINRKRGHFANRTASGTPT
jgi:hypothetical protein